MNNQQLSHDIITPEAAEFLISLHEKFDNLRRNLLIKRRTRSLQFDQGQRPQFLESTRSIRESDWTVAEAPQDLRDRRVEITGPAESKMMINAMNSGAQVFMADLEDALSPTWHNVLLAQNSLKQAVRKTLRHYTDAQKSYFLNEKTATLVVRPRGLHMEEKNFQIRGAPISAALFDFGLHLFHNAHELIRQGSGPYFYLPKIESHDEAAWWNEVFLFSQDRLSIPRGTIRATVLIETITAAFEMDEILFVLKDHASGLNAGRWDYIFSLIKKFHTQKDFITPDRSLITMNAPFLENYCQLLVQTCHRRNAHAIGGMAAFIPNRKDPLATLGALQKVAEDKRREALMGFDGTWVAHPDLVSIAEKEFRNILKNSTDILAPQDLLRLPTAEGHITEKGVRTNINVCLLYLDRWFAGNGAVALNNMMEDLATAEISRSQLWQWLHHVVRLADGRAFTPELFHELLGEEVHKLNHLDLPYLDKAVSLLSSLTISNQFQEFITTRACEILNTIDFKGADNDLEQRDAIEAVGL